MTFSFYFISSYTVECTNTKYFVPYNKKNKNS